MENPYRDEAIAREREKAIARETERAERKRKRVEARQESPSVTAARPKHASAEEPVKPPSPAFKNLYDKMIKSQQKLDARKKKKSASKPFTSRGKRKKTAYDGFEIEEAIDVTADWDDLATPAHAEWFASTRDFGDTGERSGLAAFANEIETADLDCEIEKVVDAIEDGTLDETDDNIHEFDQLPESAAWLGRQLCTARGWGPIRTPDEIKFYRDNHLRFQMQPGSESDADNYSSINFSEVALAFNEAIAAEERGERPKSDMTLKSAYHCSSYHKKFKKDSNASLTLLGVAEANKNLRRELRGTERETAVEMPPAPRVDSLPETQPHSTTDGIPHELDPGSNALIGKQGTSRVRVTKFGALPVGEEIDSYKPMHPHQQAMELKPRGGRRCRKCGHEVRSKPSNHRNSSFKLGKGTIEGKKEMHEVCTVPVSDRLPGFPLLEGVPFPRRSRAKRKKDKRKK